MQRLIVTTILLVLSLFLVIGCAAEEPAETSEQSDSQQDSSSPEDSDSTEEAEEPTSETSALAWTELELTDVETGESFTLSDLEGEQVFVQAFAVW